MDIDFAFESKSPAASRSNKPKLRPYLVALVGNPNAGKTSLFNGLTGAHQKVGNYPGVTVEKISGTLDLGDVKVECIDVPGLYSLTPVSEDEKVAADVIKGNTPDHQKPTLLVCVIDASNLERNLFFFTQIAELDRPVVLALTMLDRVEAKGKRVDIEKMQRLLGIDVIALNGHKGSGLSELKAAIKANLETPKKPKIKLGYPKVVDEKIAELQTLFAPYLDGSNLDDEELRSQLVIEHPKDDDVDNLCCGKNELIHAVYAKRQEIIDSGKWNASVNVSIRYEWSTRMQQAVVSEAKSGPKPRTITDKIDSVLTHRFFGLIVFTAMMYLVFQSIYTFAQPLMDVIEKAFGWIGDSISPYLSKVPWLQSLIVDGLIGGVGGMLVFLPQILILFFFISVLEGTGYLARAAFLMDKLLGWCGLNGRAFIPLLSSFACAIPGIMAARVMPDPKSRLATILVSPLMSCSARLPVYLLLIGAFIQPKYGPFWAGFALFAMHLLGLVIAIPIVYVLNRHVIKSRKLPFMMELPPYQWPRWKDVGITLLQRAKVFVQTAGTIIVAMSILIWALGYFPRLNESQLNEITAKNAGQSESHIQQQIQEEQLAKSFLGRFGKTIEPVFVPAGFDWRITTSILSAFPARETVVPSLGIIFSLGKDVDNENKDLASALSNAKWPDGKPLFTEWTAIGLMVFFALCAQCMATLATVRRETNSWKWPVFMFCYMTTLAYLGAVAVHQLSIFVGR